MRCTATTHLTADECLARLAACPALPRGERLQWATPSSNLWNRAMRHRSQWYGSMLRPVLWSFAVTAGSTVNQEALDVCWARWRTIAAPVRRMRDERRALRAKASALAVALEAVLTGFHGEEFLLGARWMAAGWAVCEFLSDLAAQVNACPMCAGDRVKFGMTCPGCAGSGKYERPAYFHGRRVAEFLPDELRKGKP